MRVALVVPSFPSSHCGIATYSNYLIQELRQLVDVDVVSAVDTPSPAAFLKKAALAAQQADLVHVQHAFDIYGYMGYLTFPLYHLLRRQRKPIVTTLHELPPGEATTLKARLAQPYLRQCVSTIVANSAVTLVHSEASRDQLARWGLADRVSVLTHGSVEPPVVCGRADVAQPTPAIGFFGFIGEQKGVHRLIEAARETPDIQLRIAGAPRTPRDEAYAAELKSLTSRLGLEARVEWLGFLPDEAMVAFFQSVDLLVFPYASCTASGALHLALAHGNVVLTSNLLVFHALRESYDCLEEFALEAPETLVGQIKRLLTDTTRRAELIAGCARMAQATSWRATATKTHALYTSLLSSLDAAQDALAQLPVERLMDETV